MSAAATHRSPNSTPGPAAEACPCPLCASDESAFAGRRQDGVSFRSCNRCGLAFASPAPTPTQAAKLYQGDYFGTASDPESSHCRGYQDYLASQALAADPLRLEMRILRSHTDLRGKRALEIGCASGTLLSLLAAEGCQVSGVELNPEMAHLTRRNLNVEIHERPVEFGLPAHPASVDLLVACSVLEHSAAPKRFLDELQRLAAPGALLLLVTPDWSAAQTVGEAWTGWHGQWDHLCYFSQQTLDQVLAERGFEPVLRGSGGPPASMDDVRRSARGKKLRARIKSIPVVGPAVVGFKRRLFPVRLAAPRAGGADLIALYRFGGAGE